MIETLRWPSPRLGTVAVAAAAIAIVAAFGLAACGGDDDDGGDAEGKTERLIREVLSAGQGPETDLAVTLDGFPDDYPSDVPRFPDGEVIATVRSLTPEGLTFITLYDTKLRPSEALKFFEGAFDKDGWTTTGGSLDDDEGALQVQRQGGRVEGAVAIARFGRQGFDAADDEPFQVAISVIDRNRGEDPPDEADKPYVERASQPLPAGFPENRVPLYTGSTVIASAYFRRGGGAAYRLQLVTPDAQEDVIAFYQAELARAGWVLDRPFENASSIDLTFSDSRDDDTQGSVTAAVFLRETRLTEITLQLSIAGGLP